MNPRAPMIREISHRPIHVKRRRWLLWFPLLLVGVGILVWQVTSPAPIYLAVLVGILCCIPWVADTP